MGQKQTAPPADMTPEMVECILDRFPTIKTCCIAGHGEPLLNPRIPAIGATLAEHGVEWYLITNGALLLKEHARLIDMARSYQPLYVSVSLNHDDDYELRRAIHGVRKLVHEASFFVRVSRCVTQPDLTRGTISDFMYFAAGLGTTIELHNLMPFTTTFPAHTLGFAARVLEADADTRSRLDGLRCHPWANLVVAWPRLVDPTVNGPGKCTRPFTSISVDGDCNISPCACGWPPSSAIGHIDDADPWNRPLFVKLRDEIAGRAAPSWPCTWCAHNY